MAAWFSWWYGSVLSSRVQLKWKISGKIFFQIIIKLSQSKKGMKIRVAANYSKTMKSQFLPCFSRFFIWLNRFYNIVERHLKVQEIIANFTGFNMFYEKHFDHIKTNKHFLWKNRSPNLPKLAQTSPNFSKTCSNWS